MAKQKAEKKRPGPKPELFSLYPHTFDEVLDTVLTVKPKKEQEEQAEEGPNKAGKKRKKSA